MFYGFGQPTHPAVLRGVIDRAMANPFSMEGAIVITSWWALSARTAFVAMSVAPVAVMCGMTWLLGAMASDNERTLDRRDEL